MKNSPENIELARQTIDKIAASSLTFDEFVDKIKKSKYLTNVVSQHFITILIQQHAAELE